MEIRSSERIFFVAFRGEIPYTEQKGKGADVYADRSCR